MQQEKSRALEITAERAARNSVLVISRTMPSSLLAITVITTGSSLSGRSPRFTLEARCGWLGLRRPGFGADFAADLALEVRLAFCLAMIGSLMTSRCSGRTGSR